MVKIYFLLLMFLVPIFGHRHQKPRDPLVTKGDKVSIKEFPFYAEVHLSGVGFLCGASIVARQWLLTAGHCGYVSSDSAKALTVKVGSDKLGKGRTYSVIKTIVYPFFTPAVDDSFLEYALLKLDKPLTFSSTVSAIQLARDKDVEVGSRATVVGHGSNGSAVKYIEQNKVPNTHLLKGNVTLVKAKECLRAIYTKQDIEKTSLPLFMKHALCSASHPPIYESSCSSDPGGPLVVAGRLAGVAGFGPPSCEGGRGASQTGARLYASVPAARAWIEFHAEL